MMVRVPRLPFSVDPLIAEAKKRARQRRALIALAVFLIAVLAAGLTSAFRSPGGGSPNGGGPASAHYPPGRAAANQARLESGGPVKLLPGPVSTDTLGTPASFEVFHHWYGQQGPGFLRLSRHLATGGYEVSVERGGIEVDALDSPLAQSVGKLESAPGVRVYDVSQVRLGSHSGRRYTFSTKRLHPLWFRPGVGIAGHHDVILLGVGHGTLVIRKMDPDTDRESSEAERVIQSFRFRSSR